MATRPPISARERVRLARTISSGVLESIAIEYLDFDEDALVNLREEHKDDQELFKREVLKRWMYQTSGTDHRQVGISSVVIFNLNIKFVCWQHVIYRVWNRRVLLINSYQFTIYWYSLATHENVHAQSFLPLPKGD